MNKPLKFYDVTRKMWQEFGQNIPVKENCVAVTSYGNFIYVGGIQTVYRYSIDSNTWDELPSMKKSKEGFPYQLIVLGEYLYAIGKNPERYSFREKTWQVIAELPHKYSSCCMTGKAMWTAAADLDGCIYAVGDSYTWSFAESKNQWTTKASNLSNRISCYAFGFNGQLIIGGGMFFFRNNCYTGGPISTVEAYSKESDQWSSVEQRYSFSPPFSKKAFQADDTVFININNFVFDCGVKVSPDAVYPPNLDEWENVTQLSPDALVTCAPVNTKKLLDNSGER